MGKKLLLTDSCDGLIFIDCMCNSGVYIDDAGQVVKGTAVRVSEVLWEVARTYTDNNIHIYLNDKDKARVDELKKHLPQDECNFKIVTSCSDAYELLLTIGPQLYGTGIFIIFCFMIHMMRLLIGNHFAVFPKLGRGYD